MTDSFPQERGVGFCRVCTTLTAMTFEHVPPRVAGNDSRAKAVTLDVWLKADNLREFPKRDWTQHQRGVGGYVLCERCNNRTGHLYAREYGEWASRGHEVLGQTRGARDPVPVGKVDGVKFRYLKVHPGRFVRQALTMVLAVSGGPSLSGRNDAVQRILLEGSQELPGDLRLFMTLYRGPNVRLSGPMAALDLRSKTPTVTVEVAFPPYALTGLLEGQPKASWGCEITEWCEVSPRAEASVEFLLPVAYGYTPFANDYRSLAQAEFEAGS